MKEISTRVEGFVPPNEEFRKMLEAYLACKAAGVPIRADVNKFFKERAEILGSVLRLLDHMPEDWTRLPALQRKQVHDAMCDCSAEFSQLTKGNEKGITEYRTWLEKEHPQTTGTEK